MIIDGVEMRGAALGDAAGLAEAFARNRAFMARYEPVRPDAFYTEDGQRERLEGVLAERDAGRIVPYVFVETATGAPVGAINLGSIAYGPLCSGGLGYWVDRAWHGKGLATAAVGRSAGSRATSWACTGWRRGRWSTTWPRSGC